MNVPRISTTLCTLVTCALSLWSTGALAEEQPEADALERAQALGASSALVSGARRRALARMSEPDEAERSFEAQRENLATMELRLGLELYRLGEDWRAVSSMQRFQLLERSQRAAYLGSLIIGQIYVRNDNPSLAIESFDLATRAAKTQEAKVWTSLLETQQVCMAQDLWQNCALRLDTTLNYLTDKKRDLSIEPAIRVAALMQRDVALTMLHQPLPPLPAAFTQDAQLLAHRDALALAYDDFDTLPTRRPWLAAGLSALLPGSGQLYNRQWGDALIAFGLNALFAGATYYSFGELGSVPLGVTSALLLSGFYVGNIVHAKTSAERHNASTYHTYFESLKTHHWPTTTFVIERDEVTFSAQPPRASK